MKSSNVRGSCAFFIATALCLLGAAQVSSAQWIETDPMGLSYVNAVAACDRPGGTVLLAGSWEGLYLSTDNGASWSIVRSDVSRQSILSLAAFKNGSGGLSMLAGTSYAIFRSTDTGKNWSTVYSSPTGSYPVLFAFAKSMTGASHIYSGTSTGVIHSTDEGTSWQPIGPTSVYVSGLAAYRDNVYALGFNSSYHSTNNGSTWSVNGLGFSGATSMTVLPESGSNVTVFAGANDGVYSSVNGEGNWVRRMPATYVWALDTMSDHAGGHLVIAGSNDGVHVSRDRGATWELRGAAASVISIAVQDTFLYAATAGKGLFMSSANDPRMIPLDHGLSNPLVNALSYAGDNVVAGTDDGVYLLGVEGGGFWRKPASGPVYTATYALLRVSADASTTTLFAGTDDGVSLSTDDGKNWTPRNSGLTTLSVRALAAATGGAGDTIILAGTHGGGVFTCPKNGSSWNAAGLASKNVTALAAVPGAGSSTYLLAGCDQDGVFMSSNGGANWVSANGGLGDLHINALAVAPDISAGTYAFAGTDAGVFRSTNAGASWTLASEGLSGDRVFAFATVWTGIYAATDSGVFVSTNNGSHWEKENEGLTRTNVRSLGVVPYGAGKGSLYAGTDGEGTFRRPLTEMVSAVDRTAPAPASYVLSQNYPNPFNPTTTIRYSLPSRSHVALKVFNALGEQIALLQDGEEGVGYHEVEFDARSLPSGVYFYRLTAGSFTETKRLLLLR